jgi:Lon protease-like protein
VVNQPRELPLFPLNTVLFPGMILPLHIFEPRYKLMIDKCITDNSPFGVALIRSGQEVGVPAVPCNVGTSAYVRKVDQLSDGRMNIECVGYQRFKIREIVTAVPYMVGITEPMPSLEDDAPAVPDLTTALRGLLPDYLSLISRATGKTLPFDMLPAQGDALAYWTAIIAPLDNADKQSLLECEQLTDLLKMEISLIRKETMLLNALLHTDIHGHDGPSGFSAN